MGPGFDKLGTSLVNEDIGRLAGSIPIPAELAKPKLVRRDGPRLMDDPSAQGLVRDQILGEVPE